MKIPNKRELQEITSNNSSDTEFKDFMKLYKDYTKESFSFLVNDTTLPLDKPLRFKKNLTLDASEKFKTIDSKTEQSKAQYNLDRRTANISALSSEMFGGMSF